MSWGQGDGGRLRVVASTVFFALLILAAAAVSLRAQPPPTAPDPSFVPALWVVKWDRASKLAASNGAALVEIMSIRLTSKTPSVV